MLDTHQYMCQGTQLSFTVERGVWSLIIGAEPATPADLHSFALTAMALLQTCFHLRREVAFMFGDWFDLSCAHLTGM